jgi:pimeloyl-ACP methyl ester carboxylesterase
MTAPIISGAEPMSHVGVGDAGVLVLHGFTGNPGSMRGLAEAFVGAGFHVEMPLLAGHGTAVEDMLPTTWADWTADVERAYQTLAARASRIVVAGLSMGGSLTLWTASQHPDVCGIVCVNPAAFPFDDTMVGAIQGMIDAGTEVMDGIGSDIADPQDLLSKRRATVALHVDTRPCRAAPAKCRPIRDVQRSKGAGDARAQFPCCYSRLRQTRNLRQVRGICAANHIVMNRLTATAS